MPLDNASDVCKQDDITSLVPGFGTVEACDAYGGEEPKTSRWGGPRPGFGGPQPGSGRPRKPKPVPTAPAYAPATLRWCVLAFWGQAEITSTRELTRDGYETYLPMVAIRRRDRVIQSMWHTVRVPLFPGYGFIRLNGTQSREPITEARGVREVLIRPDGKAAWVRDALIEKLREGDESRLLLPKETGPVLKVGTKVQIEVGPFLSHVGAVVQCDGTQTQVEIDIFGRPTPVWLDRVSLVVV